MDLLIQTMEVIFNNNGNMNFNRNGSMNNPHNVEKTMQKFQQLQKMLKAMEIQFC